MRSAMLQLIVVLLGSFGIILDRFLASPPPVIRSLEKVPAPLEYSTTVVPADNAPHKAPSA